ncbi:bucky ball-like isoform X2 [Brienomyrus brachyistius]|uniref:bucky ball-like isoform X2 n=1 Tax=Brienomyrus brachyistius TaxID=42636 RepID=UPI0020B1F817|nr:bucky ball-like isoform X2 [Brienomyrus brachyistius]
MEGNNAPHTMGNGQSQQSPVHHPRPFFYVQPPPQLYYMYQWPMYNPYGQFGYPGSGLHFGRPYVSSVPYMQYPGYVIPHAPLHPIEYRRMFNPYMPPPATIDTRFCHDEGRGQRETVCSEAQTETSDGVNALLEGLGKLEVREAVGSGKQLDSGVVSPDSGIYFREERQKYVGQEEGHVPMTTEQSDAPPQPPIMHPSDSAEGARDMESTQSVLKNVAQRQEWCVTSGVLHFDGSSVCEDAMLAEPTESAQICLLAKTGLSAGPGDCDQRLGVCNQTGCGAGTQSEHVALQNTTQGCEDPAKQSADPIWPMSECLPSHHSTSWLDKAAVLLGNGETSKAPPPAGADDVGAAGEPALDFEDQPYRILRLPFDKVTPVGLLQEDNPLWCVDQLTNFIPPASYLSSINNAYYSYYPQTAQERQSILSPSLDELSSRDEVFSTDVEDMDLIPGHVYMAGGEMADGICSTEEPPGELALGSSSEEECSVCSRNTCATCGTTLSKTKWSKLCSPGHCSEKGDTDEEIRDVCGGERDIPDTLKVTLKKLHVTKRSQSRGQQVSRQKPKKSCCERPVDPAKRYKEQESRSAQSKPHLEGQWEEGTVPSDQESWESCSIKGRPKTYKRYHSSHGQERSSYKRSSCKNFGHQRTRRNDPDNEGDFPLFHRGRGSTKRRGTRS